MGANMPKISIFRSSTALLSLSAALVLSTAAQADVTISTAATQNMSCSGGVCGPTAKKAVLNVGDLETMLASGNVEVTTTGSGVQADNIVVDDALSWSAASALTLDARQSVSIDKAIAVQGQGGLTLKTDDGGTNGTLAFGHKGSVTFANLSSSLTINGTAYTLVNTIKSLASAVAESPSGAFAQAANYDASQDGTYTTVPIPTPFSGTFEGLGNSISSLSINDATDTDVGLFAEITSGGTLKDANVTNASIIVSSSNSCAAPLAGENDGNIVDAFASGSAEAPNSCAGGLAGYMFGSITLSRASTRVSAPEAGGLVGRLANGTIDLSFATGKVTANQYAGGLVGINTESGITNCYSMGEVRVPNSKQAYVGGFVAEAGSGTVSASYATGVVKGGTISTRGGFVGNTAEESYDDTYWNIDTSKFTNVHRGAGNVKNEAGIAGLTTEQMRAGLPSGFDPSIWTENSKINDGLPYLLANTPK
jgi:hypothetical protein